MIGYVLLIVLSIAIAGSVYFWLSGFIGQQEISECSDDISISIEDINCDGGVVNISFRNSGLFVVEGYMIRGGVDTSELSIDLSNFVVGDFGGKVVDGVIYFNESLSPRGEVVHQYAFDFPVNVFEIIPVNFGENSRFVKCFNLVKRDIFSCEGMEFDAELITRDELDDNVTSLEEDRERVDISYDNELVISFNQSTNEDVDLDNVVILRNDEDASFSFVLVKNLDLPTGETKSVFLDVVSGSGDVCIRDEELLSIDEITKNCSRASEVLISCPGSVGEYDCSYVDGKYKISGLRHSGILEMERTVPDPSRTSKFLDFYNNCEKLSAGGSTYPFSSIGAYDGTMKSWYTPGNFELVIGEYHLHPNKVRSQLQKMYDNGQRVISLQVWYFDFDENTECNNPHCLECECFPENFYGHIINSESGRLPSQQEKNLVNILKDVKDIGFDTMTFRFAPQWNANPKTWKDAWDWDRYDHFWDFIDSTRNTIETTLTDTDVVRVYDLGRGIAGIWETGYDGEDAENTSIKNNIKNYTYYVWKNYTDRYGNDDSFGFSYSLNYGLRFNASMEVYDKVGLRPKFYAFDSYTNLKENFEGIQENAKFKGLMSYMDDQGERNKPIIIQETYYDYLPNFEEFLGFARDYNLNLCYVNQCPLAHLSSGSWHFNLDYAENYSYFPDTDPTGHLDTDPIGHLDIDKYGLGCDDKDCIWVIGGNFTNKPKYTFFDSCSFGKIIAGPIAAVTSGYNVATVKIPESILSEYDKTCFRLTDNRGFISDFKEITFKNEEVPMFFYLAGQSNMFGYGLDFYADSKSKYWYDVPSNVDFYYAQDLDEDVSLIDRIPAQTSQFLYEHFGPEITLIHRLGWMYPDRKVVVVKYAIGGTSASQWNPGVGCSSNPEKAGKKKCLYEKSLFHLNNVIDNYADVEFGGMFWLQGENDAVIYDPNFLTHTKNIFNNYRLDLGEPNLPIFEGVIHPVDTKCSWSIVNGDADDVDSIREQQFQIASEMNNVYTVDTIGLSCIEKRNAASVADGVHFNELSQLALGNLFGGNYDEKVKSK